MNEGQSTINAFLLYYILINSKVSLDGKDEEDFRKLLSFVRSAAYVAPEEGTLVNYGIHNVIGDGPSGRGIVVKFYGA